MHDPALTPIEPSDPTKGAALFSTGKLDHPAAKERDLLPWIVALVVAGVIAGAALFLGRQNAKSHIAGSRVDPYAANLVFSNVHVSQGSNFAGDQLTYVDGTVSNRGSQLVTATTLQVAFPNDVGEQPQIKQSPLNLIRMREPYIDTEPVSAAPLKPGSSQDFRLIFDDVSSFWNQQAPALKVQSIATRPLR